MAIDLLLLHWLNQTLAHPLLDALMIGVTTAGFVILPGLGAVLFFVPSQRRVGITILASVAFGLMLALTFQYLALRPRPEAVRLLLPTPHFPSFPSGHATAAFAVAMAISLTFRQWRWWLVALAGATLISISRIYLGHHFPSDVLGGAILGTTVGAACYGLFGRPTPDWRWLLWPQIAIVVLVTQMAYLDLLPWYLLRWPLSDKVIHFLLFGAVVFWLNLWFKGWCLQLGQWAVPLAIVLPITIAALEEGIQFFSPLRSADPLDLTSDLLGMLFFWWLSRKFIHLSLLPDSVNNPSDLL